MVGLIMSFTRIFVVFFIVNIFTPLVFMCAGSFIMNENIFIFNVFEWDKLYRGLLVFFNVINLPFYFKPIPRSYDEYNN